MLQPKNLQNVVAIEQKFCHGMALQEWLATGSDPIIWELAFGPHNLAATLGCQRFRS